MSWDRCRCCDECSRKCWRCLVSTPWWRVRSAYRRAIGWVACSLQRKHLYGLAGTSRDLALNARCWRCGRWAYLPEWDLR